MTYPIRGFNTSLSRYPTYTDEDVQRLVKVGNLAKYALTANGFHKESPIVSDMTIALAPFQPDPNAEVIEVMARAIHRVDHPVRMWEESGPAIQELYLRIARAGLDALEEFRHAQGSQASRPQADQ